MQYSNRVTVVRGLFVLGCLVCCEFIAPSPCDAQISLNPLKCIRQARTDCFDFRREYCWDETYQYSPCDPFERGKAFRMHTGYYGKFYNCDNEEAKRNSPYIYWTCHRGHNLPKPLGFFRRARCELGKVRLRILEGAGPCCGGCGEENCKDCAALDGATQVACSTCSNGSCASCKKRIRRPRVKGCSSGVCATGNCADSGCPDSGCANGSCDRAACSNTECVQRRRSKRNRSMGSYANRKCATGTCSTGTCSTGTCSDGSCDCKNRVEKTCSTGNCGKCNGCLQRRGGHRLASVSRKRRGCAKGDCAPEGFRGLRKACCGADNCGCLDTSIDDNVIAGLIVNESAFGEPAYYNVAPIQDVAPIQNNVPIQNDAPNQNDVPIQSQSSAGAECDCAKCKLKKTRSDLADWNSRHSNRGAPFARSADAGKQLKLNRVTAEDLRR